MVFALVFSASIGRAKETLEKKPEEMPEITAAMKKDILKITPSIFKKVDKIYLIGVLSTDIWIYDDTWQVKPNEKGRLMVEKGGKLIGTVKKGDEVKVLGYKEIKGEYRPSPDLVLSNFQTDFLYLKVLTGELKGKEGWFRKGTENLVKFSTNQ